MKDSIRILCTRPLDQPLVAAAKKRNIIIDELSFIETTPIEIPSTKELIKATALQPATIVFTSMNAVEAIANNIDFVPNKWSIYCIGTTTNELVKKHFGEQAIIGTANSAADLATLITKNKIIKEVIFFCGDKRREELPQILLDSKINVKEITVYETTNSIHLIDTIYDGILFFSPSAVDSFFNNNKIPFTTILFAIGSTTASQIQTYCNNTIIISEEPGKENLVRKMMEHFNE